MIRRWVIRLSVEWWWGPMVGNDRILWISGRSRIGKSWRCILGRPISPIPSIWRKTWDDGGRVIDWIRNLQIILNIGIIEWVSQLDQKALRPKIFNFFTYFPFYSVNLPTFRFSDQIHVLIIQSINQKQTQSIKQTKNEICFKKSQLMYNISRKVKPSPSFSLIVLRRRARLVWVLSLQQLLVALNFCQQHPVALACVVFQGCSYLKTLIFQRVHFQALSAWHFHWALSQLLLLLAEKPLDSTFEDWVVIVKFQKFLFFYRTLQFIFTTSFLIGL